MKLSSNSISIYRFSINLFFVLFLSLPTLGFSQFVFEPKTGKSTLLSEKAKVFENIIYKTNEKGNSMALDIYTPKDTSTEKLPVVIYVYGGGWVKGDKTIRSETYIEDMFLKLVEKKYAVIAINYTLLDKDIHFPLPLQDTKDAVRWVRKNAEKYNFDTNNIGFFGTSSGAHLSMLAAYSQDNEFVGSPELSNYSAKVNYVVDNYGPADLNTLLHTRIGKVPVYFVGLIFSDKIVTLRENLIDGISGYDIKKDKRKVVENFKTLSPVSYADTAVPTLIVQGDKDKVVPLQQSKKLSRKLKKANVQNSLIIVKDGIHGFGTTDKTYIHQIDDEMVNFIVSQKKTN